MEETRRTRDSDSDSGLQKELALICSCRLTAALDGQHLNGVSQSIEEIRQGSCRLIGPHQATRRASDLGLDAILACGVENQDDDCRDLLWNFAKCSIGKLTTEAPPETKKREINCYTPLQLLSNIPFPDMVQPFYWGYPMWGFSVFP